MPWGPVRLSPPTTAMFAAVNQSASGGSITSHPNGVVVQMPALSTNTPMVAATPVPSSTPWSLTGQVVPVLFNINYTAAGLFMYEASTSKFVLLGTYYNSGWLRANMQTGTLPSTFGANVTQMDTDAPVSLYKILNNGSNLTYYVSCDGANFVQIAQRTLTTDFTTGPTHYGIAAMAQNATWPASILCTHWAPGTS